MNTIQKAIIVGIVQAILVWELVNPASEGMYNIALAMLSIYTAFVVVLTIGVLSRELEMAEPNKWLARLSMLADTGLSSILIYNGFMVMGMLLMVSHSIIFAKYLKLKG